jgi:hypothetical protein
MAVASVGSSPPMSNGTMTTARRPAPPSTSSTSAGSNKTNNGVSVEGGDGLFTIEQLRSLSPTSRRACEQLGYTIDDLLYRLTTFSSHSYDLLIVAAPHCVLVCFS